jgi:uncharacterized protein (DUF885 family)
MRLAPLLGSMVLLLSTTGGSSSGQLPSASPGPSSPATRRLRNFLAEDWKYWMGEYPETATVFGYPGENDRWTDYSQTGIERRDRHLEESLRLLRAIPRNELPTDEQLNYDLYQDAIQTAMAGLRFHDDPFPFPSVVPTNLYTPINQIEGLLQELPSTIDRMPAARPSDYQDILARLSAIPRIVDQTIDLMKVGLGRGWTPPKVTMRDVPKQIESQIVSDPLASPLLAAFNAYPTAITPDQQKDFTHRATAAYTDKVVPAFGRLRDFLVETYIPSCRETISVRDLPDGADFYKYLVHWHTTTGLTPEQIHRNGLDQVKQIGTEMKQVIAQIGFQGSFAEFVKFMNTDPRFRFSSANDLLVYVRDIAKRADPELAHLFGVLPRLPYGVKPVPEAVAPSQTAAYYDQGAPSAGRPGYVYVNTYKIESRPRWDAEDLFLHEGVPGHHLQISLAQEMNGVPEFRRQLGYTAYVEGWALYAESLGGEMGFYADPYSKFGYLSAQMWRAVRLVVDTGIHSMGWSREQAIRYFEQNTGQPEQNSVVEVDRYVVWPGQALGYKIGQLHIQELRRAAEQELGDQFDIRAFHDAVLDQGALPLGILDGRVTKWVAAKKAKQSAR